MRLLVGRAHLTSSKKGVASASLPSNIFKMEANDGRYQCVFAELKDTDHFQTVGEDGSMGKDAYQKVDGEAFLIDKIN